MPYEVENKFAVADLSVIQRRIESLGGRLFGTEIHTDSYYNHPLRDFRQTDEALRIRENNDAVQITFKGPRIETAIKIREEIELSLADSANGGERAKTLFQRLGFRFVACVKKRRSLWQFHRDGLSILICLDQVDDLGSFVEIELMADSVDLERAKQAVGNLQAGLGLGVPVMSSYLRMLLAQRSANDADN